MRMRMVMLGILLAAAGSGADTVTNETLKVIFARKSVRAYRGEPVSREALETLVRAGMAAPTAVDKRPWEFVIVTDSNMLRRLAAHLPYAKMADQAGAGIVVAGDVRRQWSGPDSVYWVLDCCAATENILLAAEAMGLGAVWTGLYPEPDRMEAVSRALGLPPHIKPLCLIPVGVPRGLEQPKDKFNPAQIHWNRW